MRVSYDLQVEAAANAVLASSALKAQGPSLDFGL